jgi:hypothetical protein
VVFQSVEPAAEDREAVNPLQFSGGKVTAETNSTIVKSGRGISFVLYPGRHATQDVRIALSRNGGPVTS